MKIINVRIDETQLHTLITVLEHVRGQATGSGTSHYEIDSLCRKDSAERWWNILTILRAQLPVNQKPEKKI